MLAITPDTTTSKEFTQRQDQILRLVSGGPPCKLSGSPFFTYSHYVYAEVFNPGNQTARVEIGVGHSTQGPELQLPVLAAYPFLPSSESERAACISGAVVSCSGGSSPSFEACLSGASAVSVPPQKSVWVYVGNFGQEDPPTPFMLFAKVLYFE